MLLAIIAKSRMAGKTDDDSEASQMTPNSRILSFDNLTPSDKAAVYRRRVITVSSQTLQEAIAGNDRPKVGPQTFKALSICRTLDDRNPRLKTEADIQQPKTADLPILEEGKRSAAGTQGTHSQSPQNDKRMPVKAARISPLEIKVDSHSPNSRKDRQIQEVLERIVQKDREARELSQGILRKQSLDRKAFDRTKTYDQKSPASRKERSLNFTSARQSHTDRKHPIKSNLRLQPIAVADDASKDILAKSSPMDIRFSTPSYGGQSKVKRFKVVSAKGGTDCSKAAGGEGGTASTHDY